MKNVVRKPKRDKKVSIRVTEDECTIIDYAASLVNKSRNAFIIDHALYEAQNIILTQCLFSLDSARYQEFLELLDAPVQNVEGRKRLTNVKPEWK